LLGKGVELDNGTPVIRDHQEHRGTLNDVIEQLFFFAQSFAQIGLLSLLSPQAQLDDLEVVHRSGQLGIFPQDRFIGKPDPLQFVMQDQVEKTAGDQDEQATLDVLDRLVDWRGNVQAVQDQVAEQDPEQAGCDVDRDNPPRIATRLNDPLVFKRSGGFQVSILS